MPAEIAGAGNQDALEADAGAPAALEQLAHGFARGVGEHDVQDQEQHPDPAARPRRRRVALRCVGGVVGLRRTACETTPKTTARMLPMRTAKKSSTRERPRRSR